MKTLNDVLDILSHFFHIDLHPDAHQTCRLVLNESIRIQIEVDTSGDILLLGAVVAELAPGKFRENVLRDALQANDAIELNPVGIFSFLCKTQELVLLEKVYLPEAKKENLTETLLVLYKKAQDWKSAINEGRSSPPGALFDPDKTRQPFGVPRL